MCYGNSILECVVGIRHSSLFCRVFAPAAFGWVSGLFTTGEVKRRMVPGSQPRLLRWRGFLLWGHARFRADFEFRGSMSHSTHLGPMIMTTHFYFLLLVDHEPKGPVAFHKHILSHISNSRKQGDKESRLIV